MIESVQPTEGIKEPALQPSEDIIARVRALCNQADQALGKDNEQSESLARTVLEMSRENNYSTGVAAALFLLGAVDYYRCKYDSALKWAEEAKVAALASGNRNIAFRALSMLGGIQDARGDLEASLKAGLDSLAIAEEEGLAGLQAIASLNLGIHFREGGEYDKALDYLTKSLEHERNTPTQDRLAWILSVIGSVWIMKEEYSKALDYLDQSLALTEKADTDAIRPDVLNSLGVVHVRLGNFKEADRYHNEALTIRRERKDLGGICGSLTNLGLLAYKQDEFDTAVKMYIDALEIAKDVGSKKNEARIHGYLIDAYEAMGDYKSALEHAHNATKLSDELKQGAMEEMEYRIRAEAETKRAITEAELHRVKEYELAEAQRIANLGSWQYEPSTGTFTGSVEFCRLLNLSQEVQSASFDQFLKIFHPFDRDQFRHTFEVSIKQHTALDIVVRGLHDKSSRGAAYHFIGQWDRPNGSQKLQFFGTLQDVTLQLEADDVRHEKERLHGMLEMAGAFSHEINQPLQVITTVADLLQQVYSDNKDLSAHAKRILDAVDRIHDISGRLTSVSKYRTKDYVKA